MEEDIKILEEFIEGLKQYNPKTGKNIEPVEFGEGQRYVYKNVYYAIHNLIKAYKELKEERQIVGIPVKNKRDGRIGVVLHQWESGSVSILENINPRVINTHDSWNTLEIVTDEVKQTQTKCESIPVSLVKEKIEELKPIINKYEKQIENDEETDLSYKEIRNYASKLEAYEELLEKRK